MALANKLARIVWARSSPPATPSTAPSTLRPDPNPGNALERRTQVQEFGERDDNVMNDTARVNPDGPIDPEAIKIHRIRPADLKNA